MSSKKVPMFLTLKNIEEDADDVKILFKCGDDIR